MIFYRVCINEKPVYFAATRAEAHDYAKGKDRAIWPYICIDPVDIETDKANIQRLLNFGMTSSEIWSDPPVIQQL